VRLPEPGWVACSARARMAVRPALLAAPVGVDRVGVSPAAAAILLYGSASCRGPQHGRVSALVRAALGSVFA
jgi:hypothetical protein